MVPQFRYQVLNAKNSAEPVMVEYKDQTVNDNLLYQYQKMLGFLELTERQSFDPLGFFYAFKGYDG
jgi:hypothetical protein